MAYKIYLFLFSSVIILVLSEKLKNYGTFNLALTKVENCKGPKRRDCAVNHMKINNSISIDFDVLITENISPNKGKVLARSNGTEFMRLQLNKPCENLFLKPILDKVYNLKTNCVIKKGHYVYSINIEELSRAYYGGLHLYGQYAFRAIFYGDQCNLSCTIVEVKISKGSN